MREHLEQGKYAPYLHHCAIVHVTTLAVGEEVTRQLVTETEMAEMVASAAPGLEGMLVVLLRDLQMMKAEEEDAEE